MKSCELSVVAPCFNEAANLPELVQRLLNVFAKEEITGQIVLVNDGSYDDTGRVIESLSAEHPEVVGCHHPVNRGIEAGWRTGVAHADGKFVCFIDSDLQNLPEDVGRLYRELAFSNADVVQGYRSSIGRLRDSRYILSKGLNFLLNTFFGMHARDNKSGFVLARKETMEDILDHRFNYFYFQTFITVAAHTKGYSIREVETLFESRLLGKSFIPKIPFFLLAKCIVDLVKGFIEYRLFPKRETILSRYLDQHPPRRTAAPLEGWRKTLFDVFFLTMPLHKWMITRKTRVYYDELKRSQWLTPEEIRELQEMKLRRVVRHAAVHVRYYRELFAKKKIDPESIKTLDDLRKLPLLSKEDVRQNLYFDLLSDNHIKKNILKICTSGSTGEPFVCFADKDQLEIRWAATLRSMEWTGYEWGDKQTRLWHQTIGMSGMQVAREWMDAAMSRRIFIPAYEMRDDNLKEIIDRINEYQPALIDGYAESFNLLAQYIKTHNPVMCKPKGIISSAQALPKQSREIIEAAFGCPVFDKYGSREFSGIAYQCSEHEGHHVVAESYIVEILKEGRPAKPGEVGEVVITDLNNFCMPFIRYRIGDLAVAMDSAKTCGCGRGLPRIGDIQGRTQAIIVGSEGRYIPGTFFAHFFKDFDYLVRQYQIVQEKTEEVILKVVKAPRFEEHAFDHMLKELQKYLGEGTKLNVEIVDHIPLVRTGKHQGSISKLKIDFQSYQGELREASGAE